MVNPGLLWYFQVCDILSNYANISGEGNGTPLQYSCLENPMDGGAWWAAVHGVAKSWARLSKFTFTFHFHALEKEMATHSSILVWRIPGTEEPSGLPSMGSHRVGHDWSDLAAAAVAAFYGLDYLLLSGGLLDVLVLNPWMILNATLNWIAVISGFFFSRWEKSGDSLTSPQLLEKLVNGNLFLKKEVKKNIPRHSQHR